MMIQLTEEAAEQIREVMRQQDLAADRHFVRVGVEGFGAQRRYILDLTENVQQEDQVFESQGLRIACLGDSVSRLMGTRIDFRDAPEGRGFVFERQPRERTSSEGDGSGNDSPGAAALTEETVREALREVIDPEVGINIVDLGLVYGLDIQKDIVRVRMTMTTPACPMSEQIQRDAEDRILATSPAARMVDIDLVWDPPWSPEMISDEAKQMLGWAS
jgi:iron-sulfur cluster assembly accessory protein